LVAGQPAQTAPQLLLGRRLSYPAGSTIRLPVGHRASPDNARPRSPALERARPRPPALARIDWGVPSTGRRRDIGDDRSRRSLPATAGHRCAGRLVSTAERQRRRRCDQ